MDVTMDIAAAQEEIVAKKPDIGRGELVMSGFPGRTYGYGGR